MITLSVTQLEAHLHENYMHAFKKKTSTRRLVTSSELIKMYLITEAGLIIELVNYTAESKFELMCSRCLVGQLGVIVYQWDINGQWANRRCRELWVIIVGNCIQSYGFEPQ